MSILLTLFVYNFLESLCFILACDVYTGRKFNIKTDIFKVYLCGFIYYIVQSVTELFNSDVMQFMLQIMLTVIGCTIVLFILYNRIFMKQDITFIVVCLTISLMNYFISVFMLVFLSNLNIVNYLNGFNCYLHEFIANISIRILNIIIILGVHYVKKHFKKACKELN